jgi:hypothetical protein
MFAYSRTLPFIPSGDPEADFLRYDAQEPIEEAEQEAPEINDVNIPEEMPWWHKCYRDDYPHEPNESYFRREEFEEYGDGELLAQWVEDSFLRCLIHPWDAVDGDKIAYYVGDSTFVEVVRGNKTKLVEHDPKAWFPLPWYREEI